MRVRPTLRQAVRTVALAAALGFLYPVVTGHTDAAPRHLAAARAALASAAAEGAPQWAPEAWREARGALTRAQLEHRKQELRVLPLRDFRKARKAAQHAWEA